MCFELYILPITPALLSQNDQQEWVNTLLALRAPLMAFSFPSVISASFYCNTSQMLLAPSVFWSLTLFSSV